MIEAKQAAKFFTLHTTLEAAALSRGYTVANSPPEARAFMEFDALLPCPAYGLRLPLALNVSCFPRSIIDDIIGVVESTGYKVGKVPVEDPLKVCDRLAFVVIHERTMWSLN